ncbi:MAG: hypothetical protein H6581_24425 [Bacteroidia bacterium]|nr:hypothetical protein [Bacteroidia bacterium]
MKPILPFSVLAMALLGLISACGSSSLTPKCDGSTPTYTTEIQPIIESKCNGSGCHNAGSSAGDWTTYAKLKPILNNGRFESTVLVQQTMPLGSQLSQSQLNALQCWADNGFPEN